jgi:hypothetical protein
LTWCSPLVSFGLLRDHSGEAGASQIHSNIGPNHIIIMDGKAKNWFLLTLAMPYCVGLMTGVIFGENEFLMFLSFFALIALLLTWIYYGSKHRFNIIVVE